MTEVEAKEAVASKAEAATTVKAAVRAATAHEEATEGEVARTRSGKALLTPKQSVGDSREVNARMPKARLANHANSSISQVGISMMR